MSYSNRCECVNKKHHDDCEYMKKRHDDCACPDSKDKGEKCDCCCVQGIKSALEYARGGNNVFIMTTSSASTTSPFFFAGRVSKVDCDTVLLTAPVPAVTTSPINGFEFVSVVTTAKISLCDVVAVSPV